MRQDSCRISFRPKQIARFRQRHELLSAAMAAQRARIRETNGCPCVLSSAQGSRFSITAQVLPPQAAISQAPSLNGIVRSTAGHLFFTLGDEKCDGQTSSSPGDRVPNDLGTEVDRFPRRAPASPNAAATALTSTASSKWMKVFFTGGTRPSDKHKLKSLPLSSKLSAVLWAQLPKVSPPQDSAGGRAAGALNTPGGLRVGDFGGERGEAPGERSSSSSPS
mmetsp:Transcript_60490/g.174525  ORF Transcript_60490/g.174525 Transcript_60490/m.174525 type:complete len:221 (+) Transcript_60490:1-663(+)